MRDRIMKSRVLCVFLNILGLLRRIGCTIDANLSELEYLAAQLEPSECRRLVAALHYKAYELPKNIASAERKIDKEIPCLRQLLHWNSSPSEGIGKTHEEIEHRLRQINRQDLADWLGKTVFKELGSDIEKSIQKPFGKLGERESETQLSLLKYTKPIEVNEEMEDPWTPVDTILMGILVVLGGFFIFIISTLIYHKIRHFLRRRKREKKAPPFREDEEKLLNSDSD